MKPTFGQRTWMMSVHDCSSRMDAVSSERDNPTATSTTTSLGQFFTYVRPAVFHSVHKVAVMMSEQSVGF